VFVVAAPEGTPLPIVRKLEDAFRKAMDTPEFIRSMETVKCALTNISPRRLLFGTDYPPNFVDDPIGMKTYIQKIRQLDLDKELIEAMLAKNAIGLLGL